jgi:hypothetical protein
MKIKQQVTYELDVSVIHEDENVFIVVTDVTGEGDEFMRPVEWRHNIDTSGFEGIDEGWCLDVLPWDDTLAEQYDTDEKIINAYFNSPYGVA